ncbi:carcinoembryonic antigen-related cell adhesion molecule 7-like [Capricornis sumatraensis]|uniref:carcinoembryonic antigen-related cell adhesion molecule 7-like n=1 Tax=Capricornis sumatraensis TaxID=34865 RepID=UPI0036044FBF
MEPPSGPASRRHVPWSRLPLAVSLLTFWTPPTTAQPTVETVPTLAAEGSDVLLLGRNVEKNPLGYAWYRGERVDNAQLIASYRVDNNATTNGPVYSGRETLYPNGTLLIRNVTQKDTGSYTLLVTKKDLLTERQTGHLHVHREYFLSDLGVFGSNNSNPWEHEDTVVLTCGAETQNTSYMWWINSQSLPKGTRLELSEDKRTLTVVTVTRNETGPYVCEARNPASVSLSDPLTLDALWQENSQALSVGAITGIVIGVLLVLTPLAVLGCFIFLHSCLHNRGNWPPASTSGRGPSGSSVSQASLRDARPPAPIYQELLRPDTDVYCHISHKADVGP